MYWMIPGWNRTLLLPFSVSHLCSEVWLGISLLGIFLWRLEDAVLWTKGQHIWWSCLLWVPYAGVLTLAGSGTNEIQVIFSGVWTMKNLKFWSSKSPRVSFSGRVCTLDGNLSDISVLVGVLCELFLLANGMQILIIPLRVTVTQITIHLANNKETFGVLAHPVHSRKTTLYTAQYCYSLKS